MQKLAEAREYTEAGAEEGWENIPGGKAVFVTLVNQGRVPRRAADDVTGASGDRSETL